MRIVFSLLLLGVGACAVVPQGPGAERLKLTPVAFGELQGWEEDDAGGALQAFVASCRVWSSRAGRVGVAGAAEAWRAPCAAAKDVAASGGKARAFFEKWFQPFAAAGRDDEAGLFTGYYVPELRGSRLREGVFTTPLYARPADKISVDLGLFKSELKGQRVIGKVRGDALVPYDDRAAIAAGSLKDRAQPLAWVNDPVDAFFLEVQGSGRVRLTDGSVMPVGYDGANGHGYVAIGREMAERGELARPVTMPAIRAWLQAHPEQAQVVMNRNPSYVFFRVLPRDEAIGAQGVALTAQRSLAVDPAFVPLGVPVFLDSSDGQGLPLRRLMIAQDTGGAIKGPVRGDVFWGAGEEAARQAGSMQSRGRYYLLLPKGVDPDDASR